MDAAILSVTGAIACVLIGWFLNKKSAKKAVELFFEKSEFLKAATEFRNPFLDTKYSVIFGSKDKFDNPMTTLEIVNRDFPILEKSYFRFFEILTKDKRTAFEAAWTEYICEPKEGDTIQDENFTNCYLAFRNQDTGKEIRTEKECKQTALERIDKLLEFTKP